MMCFQHNIEHWGLFTSLAKLINFERPTNKRDWIRKWKFATGFETRKKNLVMICKVNCFKIPQREGMEKRVANTRWKVRAPQNKCQKNVKLSFQCNSWSSFGRYPLVDETNIRFRYNVTTCCNVASMIVRLFFKWSDLENNNCYKTTSCGITSFSRKYSCQLPPVTWCANNQQTVVSKYHGNFQKS